MLIAGARGDLAVVGGVAYLRAADGLVRVDVRDPAAPVLLATPSEGRYESCRRLAVEGGLALLADPQAIAAVDVADPERPTVVWQGSAIGPVSAVVAVPGHALVLSPDSLNVVDVADPARPVREAALPLSGARTVVVDGERGYVATCCSPRRLFVLDLSRPVEPVVVGELAGFGDSMAARDGTVYAAGSEAVRVIDARDPRHPRLAYDIPIEGCRAAYPYTACVIDLAVDRGHLYVATTSPDAIHVLRLGSGEADGHLGGVRPVVVVADGEVADALVAVTNKDSLNAVLCHTAREYYGVEQVVARNYFSSCRAMFEVFNVQVISGTSWAAQRMEEMVYHSEVRTVYSTGNGEVEIYEFTVPASWDGHKVSEVVPSTGCVLVSLSRAGKASLASANESIRTGDILHVSATFEGAEAMRTRLHVAQEVKK